MSNLSKRKVLGTCTTCDGDGFVDTIDNDCLTCHGSGEMFLGYEDDLEGYGTNRRPKSEPQRLAA